MASYNLIDTKYRQMAFWSQSDGAAISPYQQSFGNPGQTKVSCDARWRQPMKFVVISLNTVHVALPKQRINLVK